MRRYFLRRLVVHLDGYFRDMSCSGCHASLDCGSESAFPYTLTPLSPFPWVVNCPLNVDCSQALSITMDCCGTPTTIDIPAGTSAADRLTLINQLIQQCLFLQNACDDGDGGGPDEPDAPTPTPPSAFWMNQSQTATQECSSAYGGGTYYFTVGAGAFIAISQAKANDLAYADALKKAKANAFCANPPCLCPCANVATVLNIPLTGGRGPFSVAINSGVLPTGMALSISGGIVKLTGTPTVTGLTTVTLKITDALGGYLIKTLNVYVLKISTTSLPNYTPGVFYSQQITGTGGTGSYTFSITSGSLPNGLSMSSAGLISGTPIGNTEATFTVGMLDTGLSQVTPCTKDFTLSTSPPASLIIYYGTDGSAPWFSPSAPLGSIMAVDLSTVPGLNDLLEGSTGGVPKIVAGKLSDGWQGGTVDPNPGGSTFPDGDCSGYWNYFPRLAAGLTNKFTMRFWFRIDPYIIEQLGFSSIAFDMITGESVEVSVECDDSPNVFAVTARFFTNVTSVSVSTADIPLDAIWHRVVVTYDPATDLATLQLDNDAQITDTIPDVEPTDGRGALSWAPNGAGILQPLPDDSELTLAQWCEFYIAADYIWTEAESTSDWNSGAGRTWPDVPGVP